MGLQVAVGVPGVGRDVRLGRGPGVRALRRGRQRVDAGADAGPRLGRGALVAAADHVRGARLRVSLLPVLGDRQGYAVDGVRGEPRRGAAVFRGGGARRGGGAGLRLPVPAGEEEEPPDDRRGNDRHRRDDRHGHRSPAAAAR
ncbi:hypothetical protein C0036_10805, partial [Streptomyces sp. DJ]